MDNLQHPSEGRQDVPYFVRLVSDGGLIRRGVVVGEKRRATEVWTDSGALYFDRYTGVGLGAAEGWRINVR